MEELPAVLTDLCYRSSTPCFSMISGIRSMWKVVPYLSAISAILAWSGGSPGGAAQAGPAEKDHPVVAGWEAA